MFEDFSYSLHSVAGQTPLAVGVPLLTLVQVSTCMNRIIYVQDPV